MSLIIGALWVLTSAIVAMLPMRLQYAPGIVLLMSVPAVLGFIGYQHGFWLVALGFAAFVSMFRNPLIYLYRRARGQRPQTPR